MRGRSCVPVGRGCRGLVRWVHTSELLDVAPLLRGGELILVGGAGIAAADAAERRAYVRSLAAADAAGLAVELGSHLSELPAEVVAEADDCRLPVVELHRVVPFVEATKEINGLLTNESVRRLQLADRVSHALAAALADGSGVDELIRLLATVSSADAQLTSTTGEEIATAQADDPEVESDGARPAAGVVGPVPSSHRSAAAASPWPRCPSRPPRTPTRSSSTPPSTAPRKPSAWPCCAPAPSPGSSATPTSSCPCSRAGGRRSASWRRTRTGSGLTDRDAYAGIVALVDLRPGVITTLETAMRRHARAAVSQMREGLLYAVVGMRATDRLVEHRRRLLEDLRTVTYPDGALPAHVRVAVGPPVRALSDVRDSLTAATACVENDGWGSAPHAVMDCVELSVPRFVHAVRDDAVVGALVGDVLGELIAHDSRRGTALFDTLATYLRHGASKTETAKALHLQRQSLYQRLSRVFEFRRPVPGSTEYGALLVAVELETARRVSRHSGR